MRAETASSKLAHIPAEIFQFVAYDSPSFESNPQPRIASQFLGRTAQSSALATPLKFRVPMPQDSNVHVLRHHGFDELADWAENPVLAPDYARQSQYWASVLLAPVYRDFAEWEPRDAREFQFDAEDEAELPEADLPFLFPLIGVAAAVVCVNTKKNYPPPVPWQTRPHAQLRPNHYTTGGHSRVNSVLNGT